MTYEEHYQLNKELFCRLWSKGHGFISQKNQCGVGNSLHSRYNVIRAAMDAKGFGVRFVLKTMLSEKWGRRDEALVMQAWAAKANVWGKRRYGHES